MALIVEQIINDVVVNSIQLSTRINLETNSNVKITCNFFASDSGERVKQEILLIPSDIYDNWGTDDQYIINWVAGQLGVTLL